MNLENYFDYAAATPLLPEVVAAMQPYFSEKFYNPSAIYLAAQDVQKDITEARWAIAQLLGAKQTEIIFTAGGTEANNTAIYGIMSQFDDAHAVCSAIEHDSVLEPIKQFNHTTMPVDNVGRVHVEALDSVINDNTVLVSIMLVNNEIGTIQDLTAIAKKLSYIKEQRRVSGNLRPLYLHSDACQATNYLDIHVSRSGVDLLTLNSGKIYGPKQMGLLFVKSGIVLRPLIRGGGQESGARSGTENPAGIIGFAEALRHARANSTDETHRVIALRDNIINGLQQQIPSCIINGPKGAKRIANNIHVTFKGVDNERLLMHLDEQGIILATGSACSASNDEPSHVLKAIGVSDADSQSSVRITLGRYSTQAGCEQLVKSIAEYIAKT